MFPIVWISSPRICASYRSAELLPQVQLCCKRANTDCERKLLDAIVRIAIEFSQASACTCDVEIQHERRHTMAKTYDRKHDGTHCKWALPIDFDKRPAHTKSCRRMSGMFPSQDLSLSVFGRATFIRQYGCDLPVRVV